MFKIVIVFLCIGFSAYAQGNRPTPLENVIFKTDVNVNFKNLTNVNSVVFYDSGTNLTVNLSTFLELFKGEAKKLIDTNNITSYLIMSNNAPYLVTSNSVRKITLNADTDYIRQFEPTANVTNLNVFNELIIQNPSSTDNSNYSVGFQDLTNGVIGQLKIGRFLLKDNNGVLEVSNTISGKVYPMPEGS